MDVCTFDLLSKNVCYFILQVNLDFYMMLVAPISSYLIMCEIEWFCELGNIFLLGVRDVHWNFDFGHCAVACDIESKGPFHLSELAGRTITGQVILTMKSAFSKGFCWKTISFLHTI